jgi:hypothetical protein
MMNMSPDALKMYELLLAQINALGWTLLLAYVAKLTQQYLMHRLTVLQHGVFEAVGDCDCAPADATERGTSAGTNAIGFHHGTDEAPDDEEDA